VAVLFLDLILAVTSGIIGIGLLYASWTRRLRPRPPVIVAGWAVVAVSALFWVRFGGVEFGISWATVAVATIAWGFVAVGREHRRPEERRHQARAAGRRPGRRAVGRTVARILVVVPLTGIASILVGMALIARLPGEAGNRYVLVLLGAPLVWGALAVWTGTTSRVLSAATVLTIVSAACALLLFF
jgi:hypothetical protein